MRSTYVAVLAGQLGLHFVHFIVYFNTDLML